MDKEGAKEDLELVADVLDKHGVPFFLTYGTALGAVREKDFIDWDDDIDLGVVDAVPYKTRKQVGFTLRDLGFKPFPVAFRLFDDWEQNAVGYNGTEESGIIVVTRKFDTTIFFFKEEGDEYVCYPKNGSPALIATPTRFYEKPQTIKFKGRKYLIPSPVDEYLEYTYGDWKTPVRGKHAKQAGQ